MHFPPHNPNLVAPTDGFLDPDATNGLRARSAASAVAHYQSVRVLDADSITCSIDLLTDLLHFLHSQNEDPIQAIDKARNHFLNEAITIYPRNIMNTNPSLYSTRRRFIQQSAAMAAPFLVPQILAKSVAGA